MPNVLIVGFKPDGAREARKMVEAALKDMGKADDAITTILSADTKCCAKSSDAPYLVVRDTELGVAEMIALTLHAKLEGIVDVEFEKIGGFIAGGPTKPDVPA